MAEFTERLWRGEQVVREACLTRFPKHPDALGQLFAGSDAIDAFMSATNRGRKRKVDEARRLLPEEDHDVIRVVRLAGRSLREAAAQMGCTIKAASKRISRSLARLEAEMTRTYHDSN